MSKLTTRQRTGSLLQYANFKDGTRINLIRIDKPLEGYKAKFSILQNLNNPFAKDKTFKGINEASKYFELLTECTKSTLTNRGITAN